MLDFLPQFFYTIIYTLMFFEIFEIFFWKFFFENFFLKIFFWKFFFEIFFLKFFFEILEFRCKTVLKKCCKKGRYIKFKSTFSMVLTTFFNFLQTSVRLCASKSQNLLGKIMLILKIRHVKLCWSFFFVNLSNVFKLLQLITIKCRIFTVNFSHVL